MSTANRVSTLDVRENELATRQANHAKSPLAAVALGLLEGAIGNAVFTGYQWLVCGGRGA